MRVCQDSFSPKQFWSQGDIKIVFLQSRAPSLSRFARSGRLRILCRRRTCNKKYLAETRYFSCDHRFLSILEHCVSKILRTFGLGSAFLFHLKINEKEICLRLAPVSKNSAQALFFYQVHPPGFEPRITDPKSVVISISPRVQCPHEPPCMPASHGCQVRSAAKVWRPPILRQKYEKEYRRALANISLTSTAPQAYSGSICCSKRSTHCTNRRSSLRACAGADASRLLHRKGFVTTVRQAGTEFSRSLLCHYPPKKGKSMAGTLSPAPSAGVTARHATAAEVAVKGAVNNSFHLKNVL